MKRLLLNATSALCVAACAMFSFTANAEEFYQEDFTSTTGSVYVSALPEGWDYIGSLSYTFERELDKYHSKGGAIAISTNSSNYLVTPLVKGKFAFWMRSYTKSYSGLIKVYRVSEVNDELVLGDQIGDNATTGKNTTWEQKWFETEQPTRVAILMDHAVLDDFYADERVEEPLTAVTDITVKSNTNGQAYNLMGQPVKADAKGIVIIDGKKKFNR